MKCYLATYWCESHQVGFSSSVGLHVRLLVHFCSLPLSIVTHAQLQTVLDPARDMVEFECQGPLRLGIDGLAEGYLLGEADNLRRGGHELINTGNSKALALVAKTNLTVSCCIGT